MIGKGKLVHNSLPKHLILSNRNIFDQKTIANSFNEYFANIVPKLAYEIPQSLRSFEMYLKGSDSSFEEVSLSDEELKTSFFSLHGGKRFGFDEINYDIVKWNINSLLVPLKLSFDFFIKAFFRGHWGLTKSRRRKGTFFSSTLSLPPAHEHSGIYVQLCMWENYHIFLIPPLVFTRLLLDEICRLIELAFDWLTMWCYFCLFTRWFDSRFLIWHGKPAYLSKTIWCIMPCLFHEFVLNKLLYSMNIPENYMICNS